MILRHRRAQEDNQRREKARERPNSKRELWLVELER